MREFNDVKKRDVTRALAAIRRAVEEKCDGLTDYSSDGNTLEQACALQLEKNVSVALDHVEWFVLRAQVGDVQKGKTDAEESEDRSGRARRLSGR